MIRRGGIFALVALSAAAFAATAQASLFTNPAPITVPGCAQGDCSVAGRGDPYPSSISVDGLPNALARVRVTLRGIQHDHPDDIDALLVNPGDQRVLVMSDACGGAPLTGQTLMFDDGSAPLPMTGPCVNGVYSPTNFGSPDPFNPPAPGPPYDGSLSAFAGHSANGQWRLFVMDDGISGGTGAITGGWRLEILPQVSCAGKPATAAATVGTAGNDFITGTPGPDVLIGLGGNDTINGLQGKDVICGGDGNDIVLGGSGSDVLLGQAGKDKLKGQGGNDKLKGQGGKDKLKGGGGRDTCVGGPKPDTAKACEKVKSV